MKQTMTIITAVFAMLVLACAAHAQGTGNTTLSLNVPAEASLTVTTGTTNLSTASTVFGNSFTGATNLTFKLRTAKTGGSGTITAKVSTDFSPANGPSVTTPPTAGDALTYGCTAAPGTACTGPITASTVSATNVATFATNTKTATGTGSVSWSLTDDPLYETGTYTATILFTISAA